MPPKSADRCGTQAGLILLIALAAGAAADADTIVARLLGAIGWVNGDGTEIDDLGAAQACWDTQKVLRRLGALAGDGLLRQRAEPTPGGVTFARAALRTWPAP